MSDWSMDDLFGTPAFDPLPVNDFGTGALSSPTFSMPTFMPSDTSAWTDFNGGTFGSDLFMPTYTPDFGYQSYTSTLPTDFASYLNPFGSSDAASLVAEKPWYEKVGEWASANPDKAVGAGLGVLNGIGGAMSAIQSNKYAKEAAKRNKRLAKYEQQQMKRLQQNQAINDNYNYSIDTTTPMTTSYRPLTAEQAMSYGETGAPFQQVVNTLGETTRTRLATGGLAGLAHGGQADTVPALLSGGEYVIDADVVAALGDGNTEAGATALDILRENVRKHKRSAPTNKIPPKARVAASYLPKGKR